MSPISQVEMSPFRAREGSTFSTKGAGESERHSTHEPERVVTPRSHSKSLPQDSQAAASRGTARPLDSAGQAAVQSLPPGGGGGARLQAAGTALEPSTPSRDGQRRAPTPALALPGLRADAGAREARPGARPLSRPGVGAPAHDP